MADVTVSPLSIREDVFKYGTNQPICLTMCERADGKSFGLSYTYAERTWVSIGALNAARRDRMRRGELQRARTRNKKEERQARRTFLCIILV